MALPVRIEGMRIADPLRMLRQDLTMLDRLLGDVFSSGDGEGMFAGNANVDVREDESRVYVEADLPGVKREDVDISLRDGVLTISAERREEFDEGSREQRKGGGGQRAEGAQGAQGQQGAQVARGGEREHKEPSSARYLMRGRRQESFSYSCTLPSTVDENAVQATLRDGVLRVVLNKREDSKPKRITIS